MREYDLVGNVVHDGLNWHVHDDAGRCVAKGAISAWPGSGNACAAPVAPSFTATNVYLRGQQGNQDTEIDGQGNWLHTNVFADGALTATRPTPAQPGSGTRRCTTTTLTGWGPSACN